jgi:integrase
MRGRFLYFAGKQIKPLGGDMDRVRLPLQNDVYQEKGHWKIERREESADGVDPDTNEQWRGERSIGPATGPARLTKSAAQRVAWTNYVSKLSQNETPAQSGMTITEFVETAFVPKHVQEKRLAGRAFYQAILKHVLPPEEVDRIFHVGQDMSKGRLKAIPNWPYLGDIRLQDCVPEHIERLISAAVARGYSPHMVTHIRSVVSAIFSHAKKLQHYQHDNPVKTAVLPKHPRSSPHLLSVTQLKDVLRAMRYPEKEMTLITMLTSMSIGEICGLQWKHVNLTGIRSNITDEPIPPITIGVRKQWYRGQLESVSRTRVRNLPIPELLLLMLIKLSGRGKWTGPDDFVLVSRAGTPINAINITSRRLRTIGNELQMPWLTWHVFRHEHFALEAELGAEFQFQLASMFRSEAQQDILAH